MAEEAEVEEEAVEATEDAGQGKSLIRRVLPATCASVLGVVLAVVFCYVVFPPPAEPQDEGDGSEAILDETENYADPVAIPLPKVVVNLADEGRDVMLKISLSIEFRAESPDVVVTRVSDKSVEIKDTLITYLSGKISSEIKSSEGKEILKWELINRLTRLLFAEEEDGMVSNLFFEEVLVQ